MLAPRSTKQALHRRPATPRLLVSADNLRQAAARSRSRKRSWEEEEEERARGGGAAPAAGQGAHGRGSGRAGTQRAAHQTKTLSDKAARWSGVSSRELAPFTSAPKAARRAHLPPAAPPPPYQHDQLTAPRLMRVGHPNALHGGRDFGTSMPHAGCLPPSSSICLGCLPLSSSICLKNQYPSAS